ncbi:MAG TPA: hypothetical protein PLF23_17945 [Candidatus Obscuribacter sp.]|nr:hypothetical protein [Candidatus Obscuribacter sp.]
MKVKAKALSKLGVGYLPRVGGNWRRRPGRGSLLAELPVVLWILFVVIAFPLLNLTAAFLRCSFLYAGIHMASFSAARAGSFLAPVDGHPSAVTEAQSKLQNAKNAFSGIDVENIKTEILITNIDTQSTVARLSPLTDPADVSVNTYQIQVSARCSASPLVPIPSPIPIAGVSAPLVFDMTARQYCENPQGLTM